MDLSYRQNLTQAQIAAFEVEYFKLEPDWFITLTAILVVLVTICLCLRVYVRGFMIRAFGKDDWVLITAYVIFMGDAGIYFAIGLLQKSQGLITPLTALHMLAIGSTITYLIDQVFIKIALGYFFLRVVNPGWQQWTIKGAVYFYTIYSTIFIIVVLFSCGLPTPKNFSSGKCIDWDTQLGPMNYFAAVLNALVDWILTLVPIYVVYQVNMSRKEKISVSILMMLGLTGSIISLVRIPYVNGVEPTKDLSFFTKVIPLSLCSIAENGIGIMAISLAALRPLYARLFDTARSRFGSSMGASRGTHKKVNEYPLDSISHGTNTRGSIQAPVRSMGPAAAAAAAAAGGGGGGGGGGRFNFSHPGQGYMDIEKGMGGERGLPMVLILPESYESDRDSDEIRPGRQTPSMASTLFPIQKA
ncbi:hypothetical protein CAC42_3325 [Sphaceloma murrayae]|uniref:Rhodopsin domain-containing protein n=1 Tax=Sphaceloma murrayae TaxID=2082308 RepID=A0A2K1R117_9PEZI|nr:hypothetical protein CAC42_3325 [Sphaceloma murrayae]